MTRALLAASACALLLSWSAAASATNEQSAAAEAYAQDLRAAAQSLETAARTGAKSVPAVHVPPAPLPGPPRYSPSLDDWLQAELTTAHRQKPKARGQTLRQIAAALRTAIVGYRLPPSEPAQPIGATLASVLADPIYHQAESRVEAKAKKSWWERFQEWLADLFERMLRGLSNAAAGVPLIGQIILVIVIAATAGLVLLTAFRLARYLVSVRRTARTRDAGELLQTLDPPDVLYAQARDAAAAGRFAQAVSLVFRAGLRQLDASGQVPYDAARTAGEYRHAVRRSCSPAAKPPFEELARSFTMAAYAEMPVGEHDWRGADDAYNAFTPHVAPTQPPGSRS